MANMSEIVIHCAAPECRKPIITRAVLHIGCQFNVKCGWCGGETRIEVSPRKGVIRQFLRRDALYDSDENDILIT